MIQTMMLVAVVLFGAWLLPVRSTDDIGVSVPAQPGPENPNPVAVEPYGG